ncbi:uncharacterized protein RHIMIDRAFT_244952 [Rhizopus microsporus ATCC 52813]|uniref:CYK3 C-terminal Ig-like domain-containing protein n=2 Tax=Rhizopus microsporus TaxID=58291 RepID=A0A2G4SQQ3_RHIZD|nr:uncharacterized protein RHIMIDRAFT_244952 [Rhizopus microsporus ATCC 52813]PHZ11104.1 hypothetical protein RHIMIDRAFT_244952 [Rhizopus microsporus ATCC 52813]
MSTPVLAKSAHDINCRLSFEDNYSQVSTSSIATTTTTRSSSNGSYTGTINRSHSTHSPALHRRIHRKPVPVTKVTPHAKDYACAETAYPSRTKVPKHINSTPPEAYEKRPKRYPYDDQFIRNSPTQSIQSPVTITTTTPTSARTLTPTFWYPRTGRENEPLKRNITKKIRGLLQPHRTQLEEASSEQHKQDYQISLRRSSTPEPQHDRDSTPFHMLRHTRNIADKTGLQFHESDFIQIDTYASTVQQRGPLLTPAILSQKFLVRPYRRELFRLRALFIWIIQNIRPEYHQKRTDLLLLQKQQNYLAQYYHRQTEKPSLLKQRLSRIAHSAEEEDEPPIINRLDSMGLLQEEAVLLSNYMNEAAEQVLKKRTCKSAFGMARLFVDMVIAAGFEDARVIYGYLKAPMDTIDKAEQPLPVNHAWCAVKIEGEYRFVDCWLASPFHPHNDNKMEPHWFLTLPLDMVMTHLPEQKKYQYISPSITPYAFFSLPYIRNTFFWHRLRVLKYHVHQSSEDQDGIFYLSMKVQPNISCYAEIEADDGSTARGLAQCLTDDRNSRICKVKAVLPSHQTGGWLKVYAGPKIIPSNNAAIQQDVVCKTHFSLAMCVRVTSERQCSPFDFVKLYADYNEFYVQEPQCYQLYPLQTYHFCIRGARSDYKAVHHKLAIKSPNGKLYKLMYQPQDQTYEGTVTVSVAGKWFLICLLHHTGGWYTVAEWSCSIP